MGNTESPAWRGMTPYTPGLAPMYNTLAWLWLFTYRMKKSRKSGSHRTGNSTCCSSLVHDWESGGRCEPRITGETEIEDSEYSKSKSTPHSNNNNKMPLFRFTEEILLTILWSRIYCGRISRRIKYICISVQRGMRSRDHTLNHVYPIKQCVREWGDVLSRLMPERLNRWTLSIEHLNRLQ